MTEKLTPGRLKELRDFEASANKMRGNAANSILSDLLSHIAALEAENAISKSLALVVTESAVKLEAENERLRGDRRKLTETIAKLIAPTVGAETKGASDA